MMKRMAETLPAYQFLTAFPQIISRICHKNKNVFAVLEQIIIAVLTVYPQQALWAMMSVSRSTYKIRSARCNNIFAKVKNDPYARGTSQLFEKLMSQAMRLTDQLLDLCNTFVPPRDTTLSLSRDFRSLQRMMPLDIIIPLQTSLTVTLPVSSSSVDGSTHKPFPSLQPTIASMHDEVEIMPSLQKPRKITIIGSDGRDYIFLCKPKDDLRKDSRLMEFNSMLNKLFLKDPESRRRRLKIRTYSVVPLNEECGLIEWVPNTTGLRHILNKLYKAKGLGISTSELKKLLEKTDPNPADVFTKQVLPNYPPILHEWFLEMFSEPTKWLSSRTAYARSAAVMSMVGHVVGLGDRHGENILLDETDGNVVHVDFNCLFEKGITFEKPEKVPFRLTHNMIDAFGITGYEGNFRSACEVTMKLLRSNKESLMTVLETFIHDPLCEWSSKKRSSSTGNAISGAKLAAGEIENEHAIKSLSVIERKLDGFVQSSMPYSVEGQVDELIQIATSPTNLHAMYIGWSAHY